MGLEPLCFIQWLDRDLWTSFPDSAISKDSQYADGSLNEKGSVFSMQQYLHTICDMENHKSVIILDDRKRSDGQVLSDKTGATQD
jgi:hypothetical protein